ncbi:MAG: DEAD/DEAH box helicase [Deltaproteobacteria bacterium]|nr:DEAD/DEAH box helicase [Deltaproteobacteria bacterium]
MSFSELGLIPPLLRALSDEGYVTPTPIQQQAIPFVLAGSDLLGLAQTGTGKTAAFSLPLLQRLAASPRAPGPRKVRALIVSPTRELASQIADSIAAYGRHLDISHAVVFGGVGVGAQEQALRRGVDVVVATPGRLLDHLSKRVLRLDAVEIFVLDEADRMLDMGFIPDVRRIVAALPKKRQSLFFSATMPPEAATLAAQLLHQPAKVSVVPPATTVDKVEQSVYFVSASDKRTMLVELLADRALSRVLVFTRTKRGADRVAKHLRLYGTLAEVIHGDRAQGAREKALAAFKSGKARVLVATDIAARGIDVDDVTHVINYELPNMPESYVHRIGRTARAGASGHAVSLCAPDERPYLADIEKATRRRVTVLPTPRLQGAAPVAAPTPTRASAPPQPQPARREPRAPQGGGRQGAQAQPAQRQSASRPAAPRPTGSGSRVLPGERLSGDLA